MSGDDLDRVFSRTWTNLATVIFRKLGREQLERLAREQYGVEIANGYLTETGLVAARQIHLRFSEADWLVNGAPLIAAGLCPLGCSVEDYHDENNGPSKLVNISTGGWSGCERFIEGTLENPKIRDRYHLSDRGTLPSCNFGVPIRELTVIVDYAAWA